jgi:hypothetical protein
MISTVYCMQAFIDASSSLLKTAQLCLSAKFLMRVIDADAVTFATAAAATFIHVANNCS